MKAIENGCINCDVCVNCGRKQDRTMFYCDCCKDEVETIYCFNNEELCESCFLDRILDIFDTTYENDEKAEIFMEIVNNNFGSAFCVKKDGDMYIFSDDNIPLTTKDFVETCLHILPETYNPADIADLFGFTYDILINND